MNPSNDITFAIEKLERLAAWDDESIAETLGVLLEPVPTTNRWISLSRGEPAGGPFAAVEFAVPTEDAPFAETRLTLSLSTPVPISDLEARYGNPALREVHGRLHPPAATFGFDRRDLTCTMVLKSRRVQTISLARPRFDTRARA